MRYKVSPGLYALGNPTADSYVFVSANFRLSFDILRRELKGLDAWILVLDTRGINVWCAAGKGTFGTDEIINRISATELEQRVNHRTLIVPQLGAPGIAAHEVRQRSGFSVVYGPIRASDIKRFINAGLKASPEMRRVRFSLYDRFVLTPIEIIGWGRYFMIIAPLFFVLSGFNSKGFASSVAISTGINSIVNLFLALFAGTVLSPILLPWLPGRSFAIKGACVGMVMFLISYFSKLTGSGIIQGGAWLLLMTAISSFLTLNFTGVSTYTSPSGVRKEIHAAIPIQLGAALVGTILWLIGRFV
jgi:hypothetical protein